MASTATDSKRKTILVVDVDGPLESLNQILKPDYNVLLADRFSKALSLLETKHVDLLITGIRMPEMSGVEWMEILREQYADLPVIIQSSCGDLDTAVNCIVLGAYDYISQPLTAFRISWVVKCALAYGAAISSNNTDFDNDEFIAARKSKWSCFKSFLSEKSTEEISAVCDKLNREKSPPELMATLKSHVSNREKTILVVDDDPTMLSLEKRILNSEGYNVLLAEHGGVALKVLEQHRVDLMITDLKMGTMDGIQLLTAIREKGSELPVIVLTAYPTVATAVKCMKLDVFDYIPAPFKIDEYIQTVWNALAYGESKTTGPKPDEPEHAENTVTKPIPQLKAAEQIEPSKKTILVVDDDPTILSLVSKVLISKGYNTLQAEHGGAGLERLKTHHVNLLITGIKMEPVDGIQLTKIVREKYPGVPIIVFTAYPIVATIHECDKLGVFDYMAKPFKIDSLLLAVHHALIYAVGIPSGHTVAAKHELAEALQYKCHHMRTLLRKKEAEDLKQKQSGSNS